MTQERFDQFLREAGRGYNQPPETPRDALWVAIQKERTQRKDRPMRRLRWIQWGVAAAAVLALGVAIGRVSAPNGAPSGLAAADGAPVRAYRMAALEHLQLVETFLTVFRTEAAAQPMEMAPGAARELLLTTRLVLDSPAGRDVRLAELLQDVELVLAQIASLSGEHDPQELDLIDQGMEQRRVLLRLRAIGPDGPAAASARGEL
jgi:hypothetical protein